MYESGHFFKEDVFSQREEGVGCQTLARKHFSELQSSTETNIFLPTQI